LSIPVKGNAFEQATEPHTKVVLPPSINAIAGAHSAKLKKIPR
jgi:hypothetical protein